MSENILRRLEEVRMQKGLKKREFAESIGVSPQQYYNYFLESSPRRPSLEVVIGVMVQHLVDPRWLFWGIGEPFLDADSEYSKRIERIKDALGISTEEFLSGLNATVPFAESSKDPSAVGTSHSFYVYSNQINKITAGDCERAMDQQIYHQIPSIGVVSASPTVLLRLISEFGVNPGWLLDGEGPLFVDKKHVSVGSTEANQMVPVIDSGAIDADGKFTTSNPLFYLPIPHGVTERVLWGYQVEGDFMSPAFENGDVVFASPQVQPKSGSHVVLSIQIKEGEYELRVCRWHSLDPEKVELLADNPNYKATTIKRDHIVAVACILESMKARNVERAKIPLHDVQPNSSVHSENLKND